MIANKCHYWLFIVMHYMQHIQQLIYIFSQNTPGDHAHCRLLLDQASRLQAMYTISIACNHGTRAQRRSLAVAGFEMTLPEDARKLTGRKLRCRTCLVCVPDSWYRASSRY